MSEDIILGARIQKSNPVHKYCPSSSLTWRATYRECWKRCKWCQKLSSLCIFESIDRMITVQVSQSRDHTFDHATGFLRFRIDYKEKHYDSFVVRGVVGFFRSQRSHQQVDCNVYIVLALAHWLSQRQAMWRTWSWGRRLLQPELFLSFPESLRIAAVGPTWHKYDDTKRSKRNTFGNHWAFQQNPDMMAWLIKQFTHTMRRTIQKRSCTQKAPIIPVLKRCSDLWESISWVLWLTLRSLFTHCEWRCPSHASFCRKTYGWKKLHIRWKNIWRHPVGSHRLKVLWIWMDATSARAI